MKLLHLSDLHIGKKVNDFSMLKEQEYVLEQIYNLIENKNIEGVLIAGDIFDKPIPSIAALELFNEFLINLSNYNIPVFIVAGNHDSTERLSFLSSFLKKSNIFISTQFQGNIEKIKFNNINFYLLPYTYPALIRHYYPDKNILNYNDSFKLLFKNTKINKNEINILLAHQLVISNNSEVILSESETKSVGGVEQIDSSIFKDFDYVALGHLHCPQKMGSDKIRYGGSILKYSFSEINQKKVFTIIDFQDKNNIKIEFEEIKFLHDFSEYRGKFEDFLKEEFYNNIKKDNYIHFILEDEIIIDAKKKLSLIYPNIMLLEFDNSFTKNLNKNFNLNLKQNKNTEEYFYEFYQMQFNKDIDTFKKELIENLIGEKNATN